MCKEIEDGCDDPPIQCPVLEELAPAADFGLGDETSSYDSGFAAGEGEEPTEDTDLQKMLERITAQTRHAHGFDVTLTPPSPQIPIFPLRRKAMRRAVENVISNAIAFSSRAEISVRYRNDEVTVTIDDNGAGIPVERRADALRPFVRLETSRNRQTGGTGLGLSITNDIILGHGGELTLDDSPLGGLRVIMKLPV